MCTQRRRWFSLGVASTTWASKLAVGVFPLFTLLSPPVTIINVIGFTGGDCLRNLDWLDDESLTNHAYAKCTGDDLLYSY